MSHGQMGILKAQTLVSLIIAVFCYSTTPSYAMDVTLSWNVSNGATGYKIYYNPYSAAGPPYNGTGADEGPSPIDVKNQTQFTLHNLSDGGYRFAVTAYNNYGESGYSTEAVLPPTQYTLTTSVSAGGSIIPSGGSYSKGEAVQLTANPDSGWVFSGWSGDLSASTNPATIIMDSHKSVAANFTLLPVLYTLSVNTAGNGNVTPQGGSYSENSVVQLTADPDSGWIFSGWSGDLNAPTNPATITMDSHKSVTANFTQIPPQYTLTVQTEGQGSVSPSSGIYESGTGVTLTATAAQGWEFSGWNGDLGGSSNPQSIVMDTDKYVLAKFEQLLPTITVFSATPDEVGTGDGVTLLWDITHADTATIDNGVGPVDPTGGSMEVKPFSTTAYTLTAINSAGSTSAIVTVLCTASMGDLPFIENFESGSIAPCWEINSTGTGRTLITSSNDPLSGNYQLIMDSSQNGTYSLNELILTIDLAGKSDVILGFNHKEFSDEDHIMPDSFSGSHNSDGVAISADGSTWYKVQGLTSADGISPGGTLYEVDLDSVVKSWGIDYNNAFKIKFQHYDNYPISYDGFAFDDVEVYQPFVDSDQDGLPDDWELLHFDNLSQEPDDDWDADGLNNLSEYQVGTEPCDPDSDADGMLDEWEVEYGLNPTDADDADEDLDGDGQTNLEEHAAGTDPTQSQNPSSLFPFIEDFESGSIAQCWEINSTGTGRTLVTSSNGPHSGSYHLTMDSSKNRTYALNELILTIDLAGKSGAILAFYHKEFKDENHIMPDSFSGNHNSDGVAISADGSNWYKVQGLTSQDGSSSDWRLYEVDLDSAVTTWGIDYNNTFKIKFQHYDNYSIRYDGFAFDDVSIDVQE